MPPPTDLAIATKSVQRLVKEQAYYRAELVKQKARVQDLETEVSTGGPDLDVNAEYVLKQETKAMEETKAVFGPLKQRTVDAVAKLEEQTALSESKGAPEDELATAKEALKLGQQAVEKQEEP